MKSNRRIHLKKPLVDHTGKEYKTIRAMAKAYHIPDATLRARIRSGWTLEKALTTPVNQQPLAKAGVHEDHLGNRFASVKEMAAAHGIPYSVLLSRLWKGWSIRKALTTSADFRTKDTRVKDHLGNEYPDKASMARAYGIPYATLNKRFRSGWDLERILTEPVRPRRKRTVEQRADELAAE